MHSQELELEKHIVRYLNLLKLIKESDNVFRYQAYRRIG